MSELEAVVLKILLKNKIKFDREKTFTDLRKGRYRFDFYCYGIDGGDAAIEVQGPQHYYKINKFFKSTQEFKAAQERDRRKINYCLARKIKLYCIPYWEIDNLKTLTDVFQDKFLAKTKWKNDEDWRNFVNK